MGAIIPGEECARVYSYLGLDRAYRNAGAGVGASSWWSPARIPGCQLLWCGNVSAYPNAVAFPVGGLVNGDFEGAAGPPPAGWTQNLSLITREAGARTGGAGSYVLRIAHDGINASGMAYQTLSVAGNTYRLRGWARGDGTSVPAVGDSAYRWTGTASTAWQQFDVSWAALATASPRLYGTVLSAGHYVEFDDVTFECLNVSQATDLTGLGHNLLQATAASQPRWVASGAGGVLRFDGATDIMASGAFARNQTHQIVLGVNYGASVGGAVRYFADGNTINTAVCGRQPGTKATMCYAGSTLNGPSVANFSENCILDFTFSGASSALGYNGAAQTVGDAGASNASGLTIGGGTGTAPTYCPCDIWAIALFNAALSESERQRVIRWMRRQGRLLGVL